MKASGKDTANVLIIPTAAVTGPAKAANDGVTHFSALGGDASQLMVLERQHANDLRLITPARGADVVYFTGGNPITCSPRCEGPRSSGCSGTDWNAGWCWAGHRRARW